jgi:predicted nucleic acid-binding Zn ribbon protein
VTPALRQQVLREWRPYADHEAEANRPAIKPLSRLVPTVVKNLGLQQRLHQAQVLHLWPQIVGPAVAQLCRPFSLRNGRLELRVDHPAYIQELRPHKPLMLQKIAAQVGAGVVRDILFRVG